MKKFTYQEIELVAEYLRKGKIIAFPTETVFGLGIIYDDSSAYEHLIKIKRRSPEKPFSLMLSSTIEISKYALLSKEEIKVINEFMPGDLTILVRAKDNLPFWTHPGTNVIGIRVPADKQLRRLISLVGAPLLVPSANREGQKPLVNDKEVIEEFGHEIDGIILGEAKSFLPSSVVKVYDKVEILREGRISLKEIMNCTKEN
ncbi:MAG: L-threonylcarbamoyladenylate synthase [Bacilli bacterium]